MPDYSAPLGCDEIETMFGGLNGFPIADPGKFELALVLGGTVSAGAYTAGAVDFLIQALDCWTDHAGKPDKAKPERTVPPLTLLLKLITGTSGGGVIAAAAARALAYDFPQAPASGTALGARSGNPFYDLWVTDLTLDGMLDTSDIAARSVNSILDGKEIDYAAQRIVAFSGTGPHAPKRPYIADQFRLILTLTNLRGVKYVVTFDDPKKPQPPRETYVDHADYIRIAVAYPGGQPIVPRKDELVVAHAGVPMPEGAYPIDWTGLAEFAKGTSAFPFGFPSRELQRPTEHYRYRVILQPGDPLEIPRKPDKILQMKPDWQAFEVKGAIPDSYAFLVVDGGATDNEPIELARTALAGVAGRNPRDAKLANRAVLLVDPFAGANALGPASLKEAAYPFTGASTDPLVKLGFANLGALAGAGAALLSGMIQQTRYDTADLLLAADEKTFSRFMLTARRGDETGAAAIASSGLGAFLGFACRDFMHHDYMLGRRNCQQFLRSEFVLDQDNPVFLSWGPEKASWRVPSDPTYLPIIPLVGDANIEVPMPTWPQGRLDAARLKSLKRMIERRVARLLCFEATNVISKLAACLASPCIKASVGNAAIAGIKAALRAAELE